MATGDPPTPLTRKRSIADISPDIQDLGPALTPSQSYSDAGLDAALATLTPSQVEALSAVPSAPLRGPGDTTARSPLEESRPSTPKRARPTIALPTSPPPGDNHTSGNSTPTAPALTPWTPTHLHELFDRILPPVNLPQASDEDLPSTPTAAAFR